MNADAGSRSLLGAIWKTLYKIFGAVVAIVTFCQPLLVKRVERWLGSMDDPLAVSERFADLRRYTATFENRSDDRTIEDFTIRVDPAGVAGSVVVLERDRIVERLESPDGSLVASKPVTLHPGQQIRCEIEARGNRDFGNPPRVEAYARNMRIGTPAESRERIVRANVRARSLQEVVWSISLVAAGLFCLASLAIVIWLDRALRHRELELQNEIRLRLALAGLRPSEP